METDVRRQSVSSNFLSLSQLEIDFEPELSNETWVSAAMNVKRSSELSYLKMHSQNVTAHEFVNKSTTSKTF